MIGAGEPSYLTESVFSFPEEARCYINKVDMTFTIRDLDIWYFRHLLPSSLFIEKLDEWGEQIISVIADISVDQMRERHEYFQRLNIDLLVAWFRKFYVIDQLPLTKLTLDFSECYGADGRWLGTELVDSLQSFKHGLLV